MQSAVHEVPSCGLTTVKSFNTHPISVPPWTSEQTAPGRLFWVMTLLTILDENQQRLNKKKWQGKQRMLKYVNQARNDQLYFLAFTSLLCYSHINQGCWWSAFPKTKTIFLPWMFSMFLWLAMSMHDDEGICKVEGTRYKDWEEPMLLACAQTLSN